MTLFRFSSKFCYLKSLLKLIVVRSSELVDYISEMPSSVEIIRAMDEISDAVSFLSLYASSLCCVSLFCFFNLLIRLLRILE